MRCSSLFAVLCVALISRGQSCAVQGTVRSVDGPAAFASIAIGGTAATCDANGVFRINRIPPGDHVVEVRVVGAEPWSGRCSCADGRPIDLGTIRLAAADGLLEDVVVTGTLRETGRTESPVPVEVITAAMFKRDPSPVLFEAVGMVNGVRPQINCSVCNTGDIHINGMEGPYTMILIDGMPIVSGLGTVYGLSGIPISMVERLEIVKGPGSALYGSEAMGGLINVLTKDPALAPRVAVDVMSTSWKETNADIGYSFKKRVVAGLTGVNLFHYGDPRDDNGDGFTDVTLQRRLSIFNKVTFNRPLKRKANVAARFVTEERWGGETRWTTAERGGDRVYGENILTERWEVLGQYQLPVPGNVISQFSWNGHYQDSWYGTTRYKAQQRVFFAQTHWSPSLGPRHQALGGIAYRHTFYDDNTPGTSATAEAGVRNRPQRTPLPGVFVQDEWSMTEIHKLLLGFRLDHDVNHGLVRSPRVAYKFAPNGRWALRANFGTGYRVVNLFTEDHAALTGSRNVVIEEDLLPERSVNGTLNVVRKWPYQNHFFGLDLSLFNTHFSNRILADYSTDANTIRYANLDGSAVSRGISLNLESRCGSWLKVNAGISWMDVFTVAGGIQQPQLFAPDWSGTFLVGIGGMGPWTLDVSGQWSGPMALPVLPNDFRPARSPWYTILDVQVKRPIGERFEVYGGAKNLLDFVPRDPLMRPFDPFDRNAGDPVSNPNGYTFDTAYIYAPLQGIRGFLGLRFVLAG